ncbi:hypothetical protein [Aureispira anguillae]|uniref:Uncharacterized protein n=1 Tax=Aureispira anguillae TaxID=2864201 RepID=A0A915YLH5_9BACT|nr:hypothetical protein [Aureispira anguillae]BDS15418.1 hypothetical protein AsAng_0062020 [Aureispira anguillae]
MKRKEAIYIVKGKQKSALINLGTYELRVISNVQLEQLEEHVELEENLSNFITPDIDAYHKEILDIRLSKASDALSDFSYLDDYIKDGTAYMNVRVICPEEVIPLDRVKALIDWINKRIYHFGITISISDAYDRTLYDNYFSVYKVIQRKRIKADKTSYEPIFLSSPKAIFISKENNLYHYSRDTLAVNGNHIQFIDHEQFNIPKSNIENCKACAFRLTCLDQREVYQIEGNYRYDSICQREVDY